MRTIEDECLSKLLLFGEDGLRRALAQLLDHYHEERNHQGVGNVLLLRSRRPAKERPIACKDHLGGLLEFYHREAA